MPHDSALVLPMADQLNYVYVSTFLYAVCHNAHLAIFPYVVKSLGVEGTKQYGYLQSFFSGAQLVGGLISGPFKDRYGAEALLSLSFGSIAAYNLIIARATSLPALYLSRVAAATQHVMTASRALIADTSNHDTRSVLLGRNMLAYSMGAMIGPAIGGILASYSLHAVSYAVVATALVGVVIAQRRVQAVKQNMGAHENHTTESQEINRDTQRVDDCAGEGRHQSTATQQLWHPNVRAVLSDGNVVKLLITKLAAETARSIVFSLLPVLVARGCSQSTTTTGFVLSYLGLVAGVVQGFMIGPLTARFREEQILFGAVVGLAGSYLVWCFNQSTLMFSIVMIPLTMGNSLQQTVLTSMLTKRVRSEFTGTVIALDLSIGSAIGIFTPSLGCYLISKGGTRAVYLTSCLVYSALALASPWKVRSLNALPNKQAATKAD